VGDSSFFFFAILLLLKDDPNPIVGLVLVDPEVPKAIGLFLRVPSLDFRRYFTLLEPASREWSLSWGGN